MKKGDARKKLNGKLYGVAIEFHTAEPDGKRIVPHLARGQTRDTAIRSAIGYLEKKITPISSL